MLWKRSRTTEPGDWWDEAEPGALAELAVPLRELALACLYVQGRLCVSPASHETLRYLGRLQAAAQKLRAGLRTSEAAKLCRDLAEDGEEFGEWQTSEVERTLDEIAKSISVLTTGLAQSLEEQAGVGHELVGMHQRLSLMTRVDDLGRVREALKLEIVRTQRAIQLQQRSEQTLRGELERCVHELERKLESAEMKSTVDHLTQVGNRAAFEYFARTMLAKSAQRVQECSLALLDLDGFKALNDSRGHAAGDEALSRFACLLREHFGHGCMVARYGGDEFTVVAPCSAGDMLRKLGTAFRVMSLREKETGLTASGGVVELCADGSLEEHLAAADRALYQAKAGGKARVEIGTLTLRKAS